MKSGKIIFVFVLMLTCCLPACKQPVAPFPDAPVNLVLNLTNQYIDFKGPLQYRTFEKRDEFAGAYYVGYGGVIVNINMESKYCAHDMACPYEKDPNIRVYPDKLGGTATCEKCGSEYDLVYGFGQLKKGPSTENLKRYRTALTTAQGAEIVRVFL